MKNVNDASFKYILDKIQNGPTEILRENSDKIKTDKKI